MRKILFALLLSACAPDVQQPMQNVCTGVYTLKNVYTTGGCQGAPVTTSGYITVTGTPDGDYTMQSNLAGKLSLGGVFPASDGTCEISVRFTGEGLFPNGVYDYTYDVNVVSDPNNLVTGGGQVTFIFHWPDGSTHYSCTEQFETTGVKE